MPSSSRTIISVGTSLRIASEAATSLNLPVLGELVDGDVVQFVQLLHQPDEMFGHAEASRRAGSFAGDSVQHPPDFLLERGRRDRQQTGAHRVLGAPQQFTQEFDRKIDAEAENLDQFVVVLGAGDDAGIAGFGELRAGIVRQLANDLAFAAIDDHVGDGLGQVGPR